MIVIYDTAILYLLYTDIKQHKTFLTPFSIVAFIYSLLINVNNIFICKVYGYNKINNTTIEIFLLIFILIFISQKIIFKIIIGNKKNVNVLINSKINRKNLLIPILFYIGLISYLMSMVLSMQIYGIGNIKGENNGILGHLSSLGYILAPYFFTYYKKGIKRTIACLSIAMQFIIGIIFGGKYPLFINLVYFVLCLIIGKRLKFHSVMKYFFALAIFAVIAFIAIYSLIPNLFNLLGSNEVVLDISEVIEHLFYYLLAPVIACNDAFHMLNSNGVKIVFTVPINIFYALTGNHNYVSPIHKFDYFYAPNKMTNVAGLLGETLNCLGVVKGIIFLIVLFACIYIVFLMYYKKGIFKMPICMLLSACFFSFFFNFFTVSGVMLPILYSFFVEFILTHFGNKRIIRHSKKVALNKKEGFMVK